jgi:hypothetical protein
MKILDEKQRLEIFQLVVAIVAASLLAYLGYAGGFRLWCRNVWRVYEHKKPIVQQKCCDCGKIISEIEGFAPKENCRCTACQLHKWWQEAEQRKEKERQKAWQKWWQEEEQRRVREQWQKKQFTPLPRDFRALHDPNTKVPFAPRGAP